MGSLNINKQEYRGKFYNFEIQSTLDLTRLGCPEKHGTKPALEKQKPSPQSGGTEITKQVLPIPCGKWCDGHSQGDLGDPRSLGMSQKGSDIYRDFPFTNCSPGITPIHIPTTNVQDCLFSNMIANTKYYAIFYLISPSLTDENGTLP